MLVPQERLDSFYLELKACIDEWDRDYSEKMWQLYDLPHPDKTLVEASEAPNPPVLLRDWLNIIQERMSKKDVRDTIFDPFNSSKIYTGNLCWFKFAFDLAKLLNQPHATWFSICFPNIKLIDPVSFKSPLHVMPAFVYVVKLLPEFTHEFTNEAELYFPRAYSPNPCYVYEEKTQRLYQFVPLLDDANNDSAENDTSSLALTPSLIQLDETKLNEFNVAFRSALQLSRQSFNEKNVQSQKTKIIGDRLNLLPKPQKFRARSDSSEIASLTDGFLASNSHSFSELNRGNTQSKLPFYRNDLLQWYGKQICTEKHEATLYYIDSLQLENLVTRHGGYPCFDLRNYILNNNATRIIPVSSLLYSRPILCLDNNFNEQTTSQLSAGDIDTSTYQKQNRKTMFAFKLKSNEAIFDYFSFVANPQLTLLEFYRMTQKRGVIFYFHDKTVYPSPFEYIKHVLMPMWRRHGDIPKSKLNFLRKILEYYFVLDDKKEENLTLFQKKLNQWSSFRLYPNDTGEIQDRLFLYATITENGKTFLDLFKNCFYVPTRSFSDSMLSDSILIMARWLSKHAPHMISTHPRFRKIYETLKVAQAFSYMDCIDLLKRLADSSEVELNVLINNLIHVIAIEKDIHSKQVIDKLVIIYQMYSQFVQKNKILGYTKKHLESHQKWVTFAETLAGAEVIDDAIQLLFPGVSEFRDALTNMPLAHFPFSRLRLTLGGQGLITLDSAKFSAVKSDVKPDLKYLSNPMTRTHEKFVNLSPYTVAQPISDSEPCLVVDFTADELASMEDADERFHQFLQQPYKRHGRLLFTTCLLIYNLINLTADHQSFVENSPRFVEELYTFKIVKSISFMHSHVFSLFGGESSRKVIYLMAKKEGIQCVINNKNVLVPWYVVQLDTLHIQKTITTESLPKITAYLERKKHIRLSSQNHNEQAYHAFDKAYRKLPLREREVLDNREIELNGEKRSFKDVIQYGRSCIAETIVWLMAFLIDIDSNFIFNNKIEQSLHYTLARLRSNSRNLGHRNSDIELKKLFISLMITPFDDTTPAKSSSLRLTMFNNMTHADSRDSLLDDCTLHDCANAIPKKYKTLIFDPIQTINLEDSERLEQLYIKLLRDEFYPKYYQMQREITFQGRIVENIDRWIERVVEGKMTNNIRIYSLIDLKKIYLDQAVEHLNFSSEVKDLFKSFKIILKNPDAIRVPPPLRQLIANIKYLHFLKKLSPSEFLKFWKSLKYDEKSLDCHEKSLEYHTDVLIGYLITRNQPIGDASLNSSIYEVFKEEVALESGPHLKPYNVVEHLIEIFKKGNSEPEMRHQRSIDSAVSPWNFVII